MAVDSTADPLHLIARLADSGLFDDYTVYERPGLWTFAGGVSGEVILEPGVVRSRWLDGPSVDENWWGAGRGAGGGVRRGPVAGLERLRLDRVRVRRARPRGPAGPA